jgi:hypothetical protein
VKTIGSFLACVAALAPGVVAVANAATLVVPGGRLHIGQRGGQTVLTGTMRGRRLSLTLPADDGIYPRSFDSATLIGALGDGVLVLSTDYGSRPGNPQGECGAGNETVLRVIALRPRTHQTFGKRVESCWKNIESTSVDWNAATATLTTDLSTPDGEISTQYKVSDEGTVTMIGVPIKKTN